MSELLIKISAETKEFDKAVDDLKGKTEDLENKLGSIAKISGIAFAGLVAGAGVAIKAFAESEKASRDLELSLKNQGIASNKLIDSYKSLADQVSENTGIDDDAIVAGEAILQNFLGQTQATGPLIDALADLSIKTGSVESAAEILGRGIAGNTKGLKQFGITIDETLTKEERIAAITEQVTQKFGGFAAASNKGLGSFKGLQTAFGNFLEKIGEQLAPAVTSVVISLTDFFNTLNKNKPLIDFVVEVGKIAFIVTGVVTGLATAAITLIKLQQAFAIAQAAITVFGLASKIAIGATGIGLLLLVIGEVALNWNKIWPVLQAVYQTFANNISRISEALGDIISGIFTFNPLKIKSGVDQARNIIAQGFDNIKKSVPKDGELSIENAVTSTPEQKARAKKAADDAAQLEQDKRDTIIASNELIVLQTQNASQQLIDLKKKEIETLKLFEDEKYAKQRDSLIGQLETINALQDEQTAIDLEKQRIFDEQRLEQQLTSQTKSETERALFLERNKQKLLEQIKTEKELRDQSVLEEAKSRIDANNKRLADQVKYGSVYATINEGINSKEVQGTQQAANSLVGIQSSKNSTLKSIGKAAAVAQITIDTAKGATAAYTGFLAAIPFPPVSIPLGIAAAAAVIAYGAERIGSVVSAQEGGVVPGFNRGGDSVQGFLQPGELVVPRANFSEVVNAVANARATESTEASSGVSVAGASPQSVAVQIQFSGDSAEKFLTARQVEAKSLGTLREATA